MKLLLLTACLFGCQFKSEEPIINNSNEQLMDDSSHFEETKTVPIKIDDRVSFIMTNPTHWITKSAVKDNLQVKIHLLESEPDINGSEYFASWIDWTKNTPYPSTPKEIRQSLKNAERGAAQYSNAKITSSKELILDNRIFREFTTKSITDNPSIIGHFIIFIANNKFYHFGSVHNAEVIMDDEDFFNSISIK